MSWVPLRQLMAAAGLARAKVATMAAVPVMVPSWMDIKSPSTVRRVWALPDSGEPYRSRRVGSMEAVGVLPEKIRGREAALKLLLLPSASSARHPNARRREQPRPWELFPIESAIIPLSAGGLNPRAAGTKARTLREKKPYFSSIERRMRSAVRSTPSLLLMMEQVLA